MPRFKINSNHRRLRRRKGALERLKTQLAKIQKDEVELYPGWKNMRTDYVKKQIAILEKKIGTVAQKVQKYEPVLPA